MSPVKLTRRGQGTGAPLDMLALGPDLVLWFSAGEIVAFAATDGPAWRLDHRGVPWEVAELLRWLPAAPVDPGTFEMRREEVARWLEEAGTTVSLILRRGTVR